jgi:hypothetical protein
MILECSGQMHILIDKVQSGRENDAIVSNHNNGDSNAVSLDVEAIEQLSILDNLINLRNFEFDGFGRAKQTALFNY